MWLTHRSFYTVYVHVGFVSKLHLYTRSLSHTHTRVPQHISGCSYYQVPTEGSIFDSQVVWGLRCEAIAKRRKPNGAFPQPEKFPANAGKKKTKPIQNAPWKCALRAAATYWHRGRARGGGPVPRFWEKVFPPFSWDLGSEFCLPCARAFRKAMHISEWHYFI